MFNKKLVFALILLVVAISSVSASDFNSTDADYGQRDSSLEVFSQNCSGVLVSESDESLGLADMDSDVLNAGKTVYFDASASTDGAGTQSSPYKYLKNGRITSGSTAYFANGVYEVSSSIKISSNVKLIGQSNSNTIIKSKYMEYLYVNSSLIIDDFTLENICIDNYYNLECNNVNFKNSRSTSTELCYAISSYSFSNSYAPSIKLNNCYFENFRRGSGAVIYARCADITITNCIFYNSTANKYGGVIYACESKITVSKSSFTKNYAKYGGAIYISNSAINLIDSNFTSSEAYSFGGVIAGLASDITSSGCIYSGYKSSTDSGGAIYLDGTGHIINISSPKAIYLNITKSSFINGEALFGGSLCVLDAGLEVSGSVFKNNTADFGGSILICRGYTSHVSSSKFIDCSAYCGGAIYSSLMNSEKIIESSSKLYITDNEFLNVSATYGYYVYNYDRIAPIIHSGNKCDGQFYYNYNTGVGDNVQYSLAVPLINYVPESSTTIPSAYDSRDYGYITIAKNQAEGGNCWAFAAISTLEACLKKATGITFDFSEENIKNLMTKFSVRGSHRLPNDGGSETMSVSYFANWGGPIEESVDPYDDHSTLSFKHEQLFTIQNIYFLPVRSNVNDNDAIKKAIMDYGAVFAAYDDFGGDAHAITLIGWDDDYSGKDYFGDNANGAWIIKNSWGSNWNGDGCAYISYEKPFSNEKHSSSIMYTFIFKDTEGYNYNYEYDFYGLTNFKVVNGEVSYKNIFTADSNDVLSAFSTYFKVPTDYSVSLYVGNTLKLTQNGHSSAGYYTIPFNTKTQLSKGDQFTIVITLKNNGKNYVPICDSSESNMIAYPDGVSYINEGNGWKSLYTYYYTPHVACIKAFTAPLTLNEVTLSTLAFSSINVNDELTINFKLNDTQLNRGLVTVKINDKTYYARISDGEASLKLKFDTVGTYSFSAEYKNNLYASNVVSFNFNVVKSSEEISISAPDLTKYYGASDKFVIRVTDNGQAVSGVCVKFIKGSSNLTVITDSNGYAYVDVDWAPGTYDVKSEYGGNSVSSRITVKSTIYAPDVNYGYGSEILRATFYNTDGSALSDTQVKFKFGDNIYTATTNSNGYAAYYAIYLNVGSYKVTAVNPVSNEEMPYTLVVSKYTPSISLTSSQSDGSVTITASLSRISTTGNVVFTVGDNLANYIREVSGGKATLTLTLKDGSYPVYATYSGDSNFYSVKSSTITVKVSTPHNVSISAPDLTKYYGSSNRFSIRVTDNGQAVSGAGVKFFNGSSTLTVTTNSNGYAYVDVDWAPGTYDVKSEYGGKSVSSKITVKSTISVSDLTSDYGNTYFKATFYNTYGSPLSNTQVKFKQYIFTYSATTDSNGFASCLYWGGADTYTITAINPVSKEEKSFKLTIKKATPKISITSTQSGSSVTLTASITPATISGRITFNVDGDNYYRDITDGKANLTLTLNDGSYPVYASYEGSTNYNSAKSSTTTVKISTTHNIAITAPDLTKYYGASNRFSIRVTDNGNGVSGAVVKYIRGDNTINLKTNSIGYAYVDVDWAPGTYNVKCEYGGKSVSSKITVKSTITASNQDYEYGSSYLNATFYKTDGSYLANAKVKFKVGNKEYAATTNAKGLASYPIKLDAGTHTITAVNPVNNETKSFKVTVSKYSTVISVNDISKVYGDSKKLTIKVRDNKGNPVVDDWVNIRVFDEILDWYDEYDLFTDSQGQIKLSCNFKPGSYSLAIENDYDFKWVDVSVKKSTPKITAKSKDFKLSVKTKKYTMTLKTNKNKALKNQKVTLKVNGKTYTAKTNKDGKATFKITKLKKRGNFNAVIKYGGNGYYKALSKKVKIKVR